MFRYARSASVAAHPSARAAFQIVLATSALIFTLSAAPLLAQEIPQYLASTSDATFLSTTEIAPWSTSATTLPEAPDPQATTTQQPPAHYDGQSKRIFGVIPNFRSVNADVHLPPQSIGDKFHTATQDSFDYSSIFIPLAVAGYDYERNATPEFGTGGVAYGRYLWHAAVDQTVENYMVEFIVPVITHEDTRYYSLARGGFLKRAGYSLSRAVITRTDSGGRSFNYSEVVGAGAAAGISNLYYPSHERTFGNTADQWGTNVGIDALSFMVKEFSPDLTHMLFHGHQAKAGPRPAN
jgi:hypothetical protein